MSTPNIESVPSGEIRHRKSLGFRLLIRSGMALDHYGDNLAASERGTPGPVQRFRSGLSRRGGTYGERMSFQVRNSPEFRT